MSEEQVQEILFEDFVRGATKTCFVRCVKKPSPELTSKQRQCVRDCVLRYSECRSFTLDHLKELAKK